MMHHPVRATRRSAPARPFAGDRATDPARARRPFAGRSAELQRLVDALHAAGAGGGRFVEVVGEPGIGKTRLLRELAAEVGTDATVLWGSATEFESQLP